MSKKFEKHTAAALRELNKGEDIPSAVFLPPALRGSKRVAYTYDGTPPDVLKNITRIHNEADPIGMMMAIALGMPVATYHLQQNADGSHSYNVVYETLPLDNPIRERMVRALADKIMPRMSVNKTYVETSTKDDDPNEWMTIISNAAARNEQD